MYRTGQSFSANEWLIKLDIHGTGDLVDTYLNFTYQAHRDSQNNINGILFFGVDVTGQVTLRKKIEESEKRYRQIVETAQEGIWLIDENNKTTFVNDKMCEILEYTEAEMIGKDIFYFMDAEEKKIAAGLMQRKKEGHAGQGHFKYRSKSGKEIWTNLSANPLFHVDGSYKGSLAMVTDITERRKAEKKLDKLNRLYTFISQVNQNIVHIKDEAELFRNSCQIAFEYGKFKIAWIGIFDEATDKIKLIDQNGIHVGDMPFFFAAYPEDGPQTKVRLTGSYYVCNDIQQCAELQPGHALAAKLGVQSWIVLPIRKGGLVIGTFNLYAPDLNFFDKEEIGLLTDVSEDISFALDLFGKAKKQQETEDLVVKNEKRFRALIEKSVDMTSLSGLDGKIIYGSNSIEQYLGYSWDELVGKNASDFINPNDTLPGEIVKDLFETAGKSVFVQQRMLHKKGNWIWCEGTITNLIDEPCVNALVSNFRDISQKKISEQQKEFDSINLNALINNTANLMWSVDKHFRVITFNKPFFDFIKLSTGNELVMGDDIFSVTGSLQQFNGFKISYARAFSGEAFTEISHVVAPVEYWSEISYYPIRKGAEIIGTACYSCDITARKKAEQEMTWLINNTEESFILLNRNLDIVSYNSQLP